jgi:hypothetical protein
LFVAAYKYIKLKRKQLLQEFTIDVYFRQFWKDNRLTFESKPGLKELTFGHEMGKLIWIPDTFFVNEKESFFHSVTMKNEFIRIGHAGDIVRSVR